jgi:hypothetical protein
VITEVTKIASISVILLRLIPQYDGIARIVTIGIGTTSAIIINPKSDGKGRKVAIGTIAAGFPFNHALTIGNRKPPYRNKLFKTNGLQQAKNQTAFSQDRTKFEPIYTIIRHNKTVSVFFTE